MIRQSRLAAQVRGGFVAAASGAMSVAAHGAAGGPLPSTPAVMLVVVACCAVGAAASASRSPSLLGLALLLLSGQGLGHLMLSLSADHHGQHAAPSGTWMLAAHAAGALATAALLSVAEHLGQAISQALARVVALLALPVPDRGTPWSTARVCRATRRQLLLVSGVGTRGPPAPAC